MQAVVNQYMGIATTPKKAKRFWMHKTYFLHISGMNVIAFDKNKSKWKEHPSKWVTEKRNDGIYVDIYTIPNRGEYMTNDDELLKGLVARLEQEQQQGTTINTLSTEIDEVHYMLLKVKQENFQPYVNVLNEKYTLKAELCRDFAQRWAVWQFITENPNYKLSVLYPAYNKIYPGHCANKNSFCNFRKAIVQKGIEAKIIDQRAISKAAKRITTFQYAFLQNAYIQPQKIEAPRAHKLLVAACAGTGEKPYSLSSVRGYFREFEKNAELYTMRYGAASAQKKMPYATLLPAEHRNTQWACDGWTLPFYGTNFQRYVLYLIRDNYSRKIVGMNVAASENTASILTAIEDALYTTGVVAAELVFDKHSFQKTEIAGRLRTETERMGVVWTVTMNAQRNQIAERYNQHLDSLCKDFEGYTGKNITAKGKDSRPSPEAMEQIAKPKNWKTDEEIKAIAVHVVNEFNNTPLDVLGGKSPNEQYTSSEDKKAFVITEADRLKLIRPIKNYKVIRGQITIKLGMTKHEFQLPAHLIDKYNDREVTVVYEDLTQGIYISDARTGEELGCIEPKRKIHGAVADQTEEDKKYLNQLTGRTTGVTTKARKAAQAKIVDALAENPEAIDIINAAILRKDIRQIANQNNELKRAGIKVNDLPIRNEKTATIALPVKRKKTSVMHDENHVMTVLTKEEFLAQLEN